METAGRKYDEQFVLKDSTGEPLRETYYTAKFPNGKLFHGETDSNGGTKRFHTVGISQIEIYLGHLKSI